MIEASSIPALLVRVHLSGRNTMTETGRHRVVIASLAVAVASLYPRIRGTDQQLIEFGRDCGPLPPHMRG